MRFLVTAGPTHEPIDPVRFISNRSSGKMGYAVARSAVRRGHEVVLVSGPVGLAPVENADMIRVTTAEQMLAAVRNRVGWCDALIMAAAVADWRPRHVEQNKIKKRGAPITLQLEPAPDILLSVLPVKGGRIFVGFAAETENVEKEAARKLADKGLDLIVANDVGQPDSGFEVDTNRVTLISADGRLEALPLMSKDKVADRIVVWVEEHK